MLLGNLSLLALPLLDITNGENKVCKGNLTETLLSTVLVSPS